MNKLEPLKFGIIGCSRIAKRSIIPVILKSEFASSFLVPDQKNLKKFPNHKRFKIKKRLKINIKTLDSLMLKKADFMKIDTQFILMYNTL